MLCASFKKKSQPGHTIQCFVPPSKLLSLRDVTTYDDSYRALYTLLTNACDKWHNNVHFMLANWKQQAIYESIVTICLHCHPWVIKEKLQNMNTHHSGMLNFLEVDSFFNLTIQTQFFADFKCHHRPKRCSVPMPAINRLPSAENWRLFTKPTCNDQTHSINILRNPISL